jgi:DUF971 family protein
MAAAFKELELLVAKIQRQLAPRADVLHNVHVDGRKSGTKRQIDVLVREQVGQYDIKIIIDPKFGGLGIFRRLRIIHFHMHGRGFSAVWGSPVG